MDYLWEETRALKPCGAAIACSNYGSNYSSWSVDTFGCRWKAHTHLALARHRSEVRVGVRWRHGQSWWRTYITFDYHHNYRNNSFNMISLSLLHMLSKQTWSIRSVPASSPSRGEDVTVYVWRKATELAHSFLICSLVFFCLYGPFNCISFHHILLTTLRFLTLFFRSYLCLIGSSNFVSLRESLLLPW